MGQTVLFHVEIDPTLVEHLLKGKPPPEYSCIQSALGPWQRLTSAEIKAQLREQLGAQKSLSVRPPRESDTQGQSANITDSAVLREVATNFSLASNVEFGTSLTAQRGWTIEASGALPTIIVQEPMIHISVVPVDSSWSFRAKPSYRFLNTMIQRTEADFQLLDPRSSSRWTALGATEMLADFIQAIQRSTSIRLQYQCRPVWERPEPKGEPETFGDADWIRDLVARFKSANQKGEGILSPCDCVLIEAGEDRFVLTSDDILGLLEPAHSSSEAWKANVAYIEVDGDPLGVRSANAGVAGLSDAGSTTEETSWPPTPSMTTPRQLYRPPESERSVCVARNDKREDRHSCQSSKIAGEAGKQISASRGTTRGFGLAPSAGRGTPCS